MKWYQQTVDQIFVMTKSEGRGLLPDDRNKRLQKNGANELTKTQGDSELKKFLKHFNDLLIYVLIGAGILKGVLGSYIDMTIIFLVVFINALIGYLQEKRATNSLNSLTSLLSEEATILIDGEKTVVPARELVIGDVVMLNAGDIVPADVRISESFNLVVEEAILTGESTPVNKETAAIDKDVDLGDCINMAFSGTLINSGSGTGIVISTGDDTELGKISQSLQDVGDTETPLIKKMHKLNKQIFYILLVLIVFLVIFSFFFNSFGVKELAIAVIALAVSAVPEGLPAVLSIILSMGVTKMAHKHAIIKNMPAVETLGSMSVINSDKTGTLTKNEMTVVSVITKDYDVDIAEKEQAIDIMQAAPNKFACQKMIETALICNDTKIEYTETGERKVIGDPTEAALLEFATTIGLEKEETLIDKIPFDSSYKYMAVLVEVENKKFVYLKGAPDVVLDITTKQIEQEQVVAIDETYWNTQISKHAKRGQRMLAIAFKEVDQTKQTITHDDLQENLTLVGLYGIIDPPKKSAIDAIAITHAAGIDVKMITGDHKDTAVAIAQEIGLKHYQNAVTGSELEQMSDTELQEIVKNHDVFARTTPEHKLRLVKVMQADGKIVGMTGDGVNDAPALKKADIGIAMGIKGTQVTKDAADMVLADDNFATIAEAVKEGRRVYDNLKKTIYFALPTAFAQGLLVVGAILFDIPLPLTSVQILWLNMVTTITLSFALGFEPLAKEAMQRPPRDPKENILDKYAIFRIIYVSLMIAILGFAVDKLLINEGVSEAGVQTTLLNAIVFAQAFYMINCRELFKFSINKTILQNKVLWLSLLILIILQAAVIYLPPMHFILGTTAITIRQLMLTFAIGITVFIIVEIEKFITRSIKKI